MDSILDRVGTTYPWTHFEIAVAFMAARCGTLDTLFERLLPYVQKTSVSEIHLDTSTWKTFWRSVDFVTPESERPLDSVEGIMPANYNELVHQIGAQRAPWFYLARFAEDPAGLLAELYPDVPQERRAALVSSALVIECPVDAAHVLLNVACPSEFGTTAVVASHAEAPLVEAPKPNAGSDPARAPRVVTRKSFFEMCGVPVHTSKKNKVILLFSSRQKECATLWGWRFPEFEFYFTAHLFQMLESDFLDFVRCVTVQEQAPHVQEFRKTMESMVASEDLVGLDINTVAAMMLASFEPNRVDAWRALGFAIDSTAARKAALFVQSFPTARLDLLTHLASL